jgi:hypothetical protein
MSASIAQAKEESPTRTIEVNGYSNYFGLSYHRNNDWTFQCGELLTQKVLQLLVSVPQDLRADVLGHLRQIEVVDHVPAPIFGRHTPHAEFEEDDGVLRVEFVRLTGRGNQRAYCNDSSINEVTRLIIGWREEARASRIANIPAVTSGPSAGDRAAGAQQSQIVGLMDQLLGANRAPAVDPSAHVSDQETVARPVAPPEPSVAPAPAPVTPVQAESGQ